MPKFNYVAMDGQGKEKKGVLNADNQNDATSKLKEQGLFPTSLAEDKAGGKKVSKKGAAKQRKAGKKKGGMSLNIQLGTPVIKTKLLCQFTRQMGTLLDAGLPLLRGLRTLEKQAKDPALNKIVGEVADDVEGGLTFSESLGKHPKSFNRLFVNMIRAGEASGAMEGVLNRLAEFMEKAAKLRAKVKTALTYPLAVLFIALSITSGLMIFIVPKFAKMFDEMLAGEPLPALTEFVMAISDFMKTRAIHGAVGIVVGFILFKQILKTNMGGYIFDYLSIKVPPINDLVIKVNTARFCSTLGTLMSSGVSILNALMIVRDTSGNRVIANAVQMVHDAVAEGEGMTKPLNASRVFPGMVVSMIEVGEETGALPDMLERIAHNYEEEVDQTVEALTSLIEPAMIVFLAIVVGGIVIALFLPLIKLIDTLGG